MKTISDLVGNIPHVEFDFIKDWNDQRKEPTYGIDCPICLNKGFIRRKKDENGENTIDNSYLIQCKCMNQRKCIENTKKSGLGDLLENRIKDYQAYSDITKKVKKAAVNYLQTNSKLWFCVLGQSGSGKTHLCSAICNELLKRGHVVIYSSWNTFVSEYKHSIRNGDNIEMIEKLQTCEVLYIDDLFKGSQSDFDVKNIAYDIINYRYNNNLTTIISSEYLLDDLLDIDAAIAGRIKEKCREYIFEIVGNDHNFRLK